jgi:Glycosyltransferase like family 2
MRTEASDIQTGQDRELVLSERVFTTGDWLLFSGLSVLRIGALAWFFVYWFEPTGWWDSEKFSFAGASALLLIGLAGNQLRWIALPLMKRPIPMEPRQGLRVAVVTTCVPYIEPLEMLDTTLRAMVSLDYPHDTWLLDEGDSPSVRDLCRSIGVRHFSRHGLPHYQRESGRFTARSKHGNYNAWLQEVGFEQYDVLIAFDPDHVAAPEFASSVLGFFEDERIAYVQAPQVYRNQSASLIARGAAEETYAYYSATEMASYGVGEPVLTGCHNAHRLSALREFGGFPDHTAEDLLQTLYYRIRGWHGVYVPTVLATGLAPEEWASYLTQQLRWARSVLDIKFRHFHALRGSPSRETLIELLQGFGYLQDAFLAVGSLALFVPLLAAGIGRATFEHLGSPDFGALLALMFSSDMFRQRFYLQPKTETGIHWCAGLLRLAKWPFLLKAFWLVVRNQQFQYVVTPKTRSASSSRMLLRAHGAVVVLVASAWVVGVLVGQVHGWLVHIWAAAIIALSVGLILSETQHRNGRD